MNNKKTLQNYIFILPALLVFFVFYVLPFIWVFRLSFTDWDGIQPTKNYVGLANFKEILFYDKEWWQSIYNASYICLFALTIQNFLAFALAVACNSKIRFKSFYQTIFFIPPILSEIVVGMLWRFILNDIEGANILNRLLIFFGLSNFINSWLSNPNTVLTVVAIIHCWKGFGWAFLIFLAGLKTIPTELMDMAKLDGANTWNSITKIILPLLMPTILLVVILTILGTMQAFALILSLVGGEFAGYTSVPVLRILANMKDHLRFGYACAQGIVFGIILVFFSILQYKLIKRTKQLIA